MEQSSSLESNSNSFSQEIPRLLRNLNVRYHAHKSLALVPVLSQMSTHSQPLSFKSIAILSSYLRLYIPHGIFLSGFPTKMCIHMSSLPFMLHDPPASSFLI